MDHAVQAIAAAIGNFFVVSILLTGAILLCQRRNSTKTRTRGSHTRTRPVPTRNASLPFSITVVDSWSSDPNLIKMSWEELARATDNFSPHLIVGDDSFGLVYKVRLSIGVVVAVKKLSLDAFQGFCEFTAEMETLSRLRHPNIVKILEYWSFGPEHKCCEVVYYAVDAAEAVTVKCLLQSSAFGHSKLGVLLVLLWWLLYVLLFISVPGRGLRVHALTHQVSCLQHNKH